MPRDTYGPSVATPSGQSQSLAKTSAPETSNPPAERSVEPEASRVRLLFVAMAILFAPAILLMLAYAVTSPGSGNAPTRSTDTGAAGKSQPLTLWGDAQLNDNPPEYIKEVVAYPEGTRAFVIYFILADSTGAMTTSDGWVYLSIYETVREWSSEKMDFVETERLLYRRFDKVRKSDFVKTTRGRGTFEQEVILYSFGRIPYSSFDIAPTESSGRVTVHFHTLSGSILDGEDTIFFDR